MKVLGVDPGTQRTGWGIVEVRGSRIVGVGAGVVRADASLPLAARLQRIYDGLCGVIAELGPQEVAVETIFHAKYANAAIKLGHVRGVALLAAANASLPVHDYAPALVKRTVGGRGAADKRQLAAIVGTILGWTDLPSADATDALAVAITHAQAARFAKATHRAR